MRPNEQKRWRSRHPSGQHKRFEGSRDPNPLNRFNINNFSPLQKETDGSLKLAIGPKPIPAVAESNWLPSPEGKPFSLTFRTYVPKDIVKAGEWQPAPVMKVN